MNTHKKNCPALQLFSFPNLGISKMPLLWIVLFAIAFPDAVGIVTNVCLGVVHLVADFVFAGSSRVNNTVKTVKENLDHDLNAYKAHGGKTTSYVY